MTAPDQYVHLLDASDAEREAVAMQRYDRIIRDARLISGVPDDASDLQALEEMVVVACDYERRRAIATEAKGLGDAGGYEAVPSTPESEREAYEGMAARGLHRPHRVVMTPGTMLGQPRIEETRITVESLLARLRVETIPEIGRDVRLPEDWWVAIQDWLKPIYPHLFDDMSDWMIAEMQGISEHMVLRVRRYVEWVHEKTGKPLPEAGWAQRKDDESDADHAERMDLLCRFVSGRAEAASGGGHDMDDVIAEIDAIIAQP